LPPAFLNGDPAVWAHFERLNAEELRDEHLAGTPIPADLSEEERAQIPDPPVGAEDLVGPRALSKLPGRSDEAARSARAVGDWRTHDRLRRAEVLLDRIPKLRESVEDAQAIKELEVAMRQDLPSAAREKLSFELGDLLKKMWETQRACRHWKDHACRYPAKKFDGQVQAARTEREGR